MSKIWSAMVGSNIRVYMAETTSMVEDAINNHGPSKVSSIALGRTLTASSLLGKLLKNEKDVLTLKIAGTNQIKGLLASANYHGDVKGYVSNLKADLSYQLNTDRIGDAIGKGGSITVIRDFGLKEPYVGISHLISGEIDEDVAFYYKNSEQQPTLMKTDINFDGDNFKSAAGLLIQTLPEVSDFEKKAFELSETQLSDLSVRLDSGETPEAILASIFRDLEVRMTGEYACAFKCDCSRDRISRALLTVGRDELKEILSVDQKADLHCHFCNTEYHFTKEDLVAMIEALNG